MICLMAVSVVVMIIDARKGDSVLVALDWLGFCILASALYVKGVL